MLGKLENYKKEDWKYYICITYVLHTCLQCNKTKDNRIRPHYLMFGWHPKLAIDAFLNLDNSDVSGKHISHLNYAEKLKKRLQFAYKVARSNIEKNSLTQRKF